MVFSKPSNVPYPKIWRRFQVQNGSVTLRIQDLTEDLYENAMQLLTTYFTRDEPPCKYIGIQNHPTALLELQKLWRMTIKDKLSLVCVVDDDELPPKVVGVNVLTVVCKEDKEEPFKTDDKIWATLFGAVDLVSRSVDIFAHYNVDKYLTAYGLVVDPKWRGMNVGKELLEARCFIRNRVNEEISRRIRVDDMAQGIAKLKWLWAEYSVPLCRALNVKVTATVFTAGASQAVAKKAGFVALFEISYEELAKKGFANPGVEKDTKSSKLMALVIE